MEPEVVIAPPSLTQIFFIMRDPSFYLPEAFVKGHWYVESGNLADLVVLLHNRRGAKPPNSGVFGGLIRTFLHVRKQYVQPLLTREVKTHYNSNSKLFELILGPSMVYSCAFFDEDHKTLEEAQENKLSTTMSRLGVDPDQPAKILDIGCGWGSFAKHAASHPGVHVDGISIAQSQIEYASDRTKSSELAGSTEFLVADYRGFDREHAGSYDHIVSIGMLEHVGKTQYPVFFKSVYALLKVNGTAVIHSIVRRNDGRMNPWLDKYIFPGGFVPRASEVLRGIEVSGLTASVNYFHAGENYKRTLSKWLRNLTTNREQALEILASDVEAIAASQGRTLESSKRRYLAECAFRKWEFYLAGIQVIFDRSGGNFDVCQFKVVKEDRTFWT
ncbi:cyclopropane-fatty-acyl-phospholipid synthase family protein [Cognatiyoonia sp. IB215182]|uniref:cyclopropane-fatty-acyl-phospholipid synthase family protein n=1 Tax=Cognatiyoonia sp. IB215182 TaxID=3097353 RepID=UPI002A118A33|nr:cyclopropane-fatty-acyl-phospholipid synthase family protein [Cognatiyoonia sp. IB215182]MDX8355858.1 cyclopropane-fatty-acyl-phospholipid synthase family protein [Cognatiyoonia sp. IB215182]